MTLISPNNNTVDGLFSWFYRCKARCVLDVEDGRLQFTSLVHNHDIGKFREKSSTKQGKKLPEKKTTWIIKVKMEELLCVQYSNRW